MVLKMLLKELIPKERLRAIDIAYANDPSVKIEVMKMAFGVPYMQRNAFSELLNSDAELHRAHEFSLKRGSHE
jgi:hypothetical protein